MIANASAARFDGLFTSSERSIHIAGIRISADGGIIAGEARLRAAEKQGHA
jgi:hypothetical protein